MDSSHISWMLRAKKDIDTAKLLLDNGRFEESAFFSQQAAEKAMKAVIIKKSGKLRKIHDLVELGKDVRLPAELLDEAKELTMAYIYSRYPDTNGAKNMKEKAAEFI
jgi:HEPN domain-containing protein